MESIVFLNLIDSFYNLFLSKMPCATKKRKDGTKYAGCWTEKGGAKTKSTLPKKSNPPMGPRQRLIAGLNPIVSPVQRTPGYNQARANLISGGDVVDEYTSARANLIGTGSPFIMDYGFIDIGRRPDNPGRINTGILNQGANITGMSAEYPGNPYYMGNQGPPGRINTGILNQGANMTGMSAEYPVNPYSMGNQGPPGRINTGGGNNVALDGSKMAKPESSIKRGVYTDKWDKKNPPRHLVKKGQVAIFNNKGEKRYVVLSKKKALDMVKSHMSSKVYDTFRKRLTDSTHSTYVDWELHTSNKLLLKLFKI